MSALNRISYWLFLALIASLPFESRFSFFGLSNLQWVFVAAAVAGAPGLLAAWREFAGDRVSIVAGALALSYWVSAALADEFPLNAVQGAARLTVGLAILRLARQHSRGPLAVRIWCATSIAAALYALSEHLGLVGSDLFRTENFYIGTTERLSGSFEYPTTAAAFFAMSLPLVWLVPTRRWVRFGGTALLWAVLVLTYSRGAMLAVLAAYLVFWLLTGRVSQWKGPASFAAIGVAAFVLSSLASPLLLTRLSSTTSDNPFSARYELAVTGLRQTPDTEDATPVTLINDGAVAWEAAGPEAVVLMSRWFHVPSGTLLDESRRETPIPSDVPPGTRVTIDGAFVTPTEPGEYLLIWDLRTGEDWFSRLRIAPTFAEAEIALGAERATDRRDLSSRRPAETSRPLDASVSRSMLWRAASRMFVDRPLVGVGGDNFRLLYGKYLGYTSWDTSIRSNSLYLEILATTGILGFLAFLVLVRSIPWGWSAVSIALGVFLLHGLVDVFLMSTPIYFGFWILIGLNQRQPDPQ